MCTKPKMIAIEGIDGSGKTLQFHLLENLLQQKGYTHLSVSFPIYDSFFGKEIGRMLSGNDKIRADKVDAKSMALWYAMDRKMFFSEKELQGVDYLLLNRYTLSNAVYQSLQAENPEAFADWIFQLEHQYLKLPEPDVYIVLDVDTNLSKQNVKKKGYRSYVGAQPDVYEQSEALLTLARACYIHFSQKLDHVHIVPSMAEGAMRAPEEIHWDIRGIINL